MDIAELVKRKRPAMLRIAARHGAKNLRLFGSVARGEAGPSSDIDFLVDVDTRHSQWFPGGLLLDLEEELGCRVDVVTEDALHWYIRDRVINEAVPLRHRGPPTSVIFDNDGVLTDTEYTQGMTAGTPARDAILRIVEDMTEQEAADLLDHLNMLADPDSLTDEELTEVQAAEARMKAEDYVTLKDLRPEFGGDVSASAGPPGPEIRPKS